MDAGKGHKAAMMQSFCMMLNGTNLSHRVSPAISGIWPDVPTSFIKAAPSRHFRLTLTRRSNRRANGKADKTRNRARALARTKGWPTLRGFLGELQLIFADKGRQREARGA